MAGGPEGIADGSDRSVARLRRSRRNGQPDQQPSTTTPNGTEGPPNTNTQTDGATTRRRARRVEALPVPQEPPSKDVLEGSEEGPRPTITVDLDMRSVAALLLSIVAMLGLFALVRATPRSLTWITVGALLALALNPIVTAVQRRLKCRRGTGVAVVLSGLIGGLIVLGVVLGPPAVKQAQDFGHELPKVLQQMTKLPIVGDRLKRANAPVKVEQWIDQLPSRLGGNTRPLTDLTRSLLGGAIAAFMTTLVTVALLLDGERVLRGLRRLIPLNQRARADRMGGVLYRIVGRYFAGSVLIALICGFGVLILGVALGIPLTPVAAVWAILTDLIPQIGGLLGGVLFVGLAFTSGASTGLIALAYWLVWLQVKHNIIVPAVVGDAIDLSPPITMVAALIGGSAAGVPGALIAVPLFGATKAIYLELRPPAVPRPPKRHKRGRIRRALDRLRRR